MVFQQIHSFYKDEFTVLRGKNLRFDTHIHRSFEIYTQVEGQSKIVIEDKEYILSKGEAVLIFPYQYHSYDYIGSSEYRLIIFSISLVPDFNGIDRIPNNNKFNFSLPENPAMDNLFLKQGLAYSICGSFDIDRCYSKRKSSFLNDGLVTVLIYINKNYKQNCLLRDAVNEVGYEYTYISKMFKKSTGMTFNQYINRLRIHEGQNLLKKTTLGVSEIATECGFNSLRSFNRKFVEIVGTTPTKYRQSK